MPKVNFNVPIYKPCCLCSRLVKGVFIPMSYKPLNNLSASAFRTPCRTDPKSLGHPFIFGLGYSVVSTSKVAYVCFIIETTFVKFIKLNNLSPVLRVGLHQVHMWTTPALAQAAKATPTWSTVTPKGATTLSRSRLSSLLTSSPR